MNILYISILIYFLCGIEYSYQLHKKTDTLDFEPSLKQIIFAVFYIPAFWLVYYLKAKAKRINLKQIMK